MHVIPLPQHAMGPIGVNTQEYEPIEACHHDHVTSSSQSGARVVDDVGSGGYACAGWECVTYDDAHAHDVQPDDYQIQAVAEALVITNCYYTDSL